MLKRNSYGTQYCGADRFLARGSNTVRKIKAEYNNVQAEQLTQSVRVADPIRALDPDRLQLSLAVVMEPVKRFRCR